MSRSVSAREAKNRLGALIGWVKEHGDEVIVENRGKPAAVIVSFTEYEKLRALREEARRQEALARLRQVKEQVSARNRDLTEEQALELADRFAHDMVDELAAQGKIRCERDASP